MAKKHRHRQVAPPPRSEKNERPAAPEPDREELTAVICRLFCEGHPPSRIKDYLEAQYGWTISRETPWVILAEAAALGRFRYQPPDHEQLARNLGNAYPWLQSVRVIWSREPRDLAKEGAQQLWKLILDKAQADGDKGHIRVGMAGGYLLGMLFKTLSENIAKMLVEERDQDGESRFHLLGMPPAFKIIFHALLGGTDMREEGVRVSPNSFFQYFVDHPALPREFKTNHLGFIGLNLPAVVGAEEFKLLKLSDTYKLAEREAKKIQIVVTSAGHWRLGKQGDPHGEEGHSNLCQMFVHQLKRHYVKELLKKRGTRSPAQNGLDDLSEEEFAKLYEEHRSDVLSRIYGKLSAISADMMWDPLLEHDPSSKAYANFVADLPCHQMSALGLRDIQAGIRDGKRVLLVLSPCGLCNEPKLEPLRLILQHRLITDLVIDSVTARKILAEIKGREGRSERPCDATLARGPYVDK